MRNFKNIFVSSLVFLLLILIEISLSGCSADPNELSAENIESESIKITYNATFYDNYGNNWLSVTGSSFDIKPNKIKEYSEKTFEDIKAYMTHNNFFDSRDAEAFFDICFNSSYNYFYTAGAGARAIPENAPSSSKSPAELIESYRNQMDEMFENEIGDTLSGYIAMFGEE